jgi:PAS domain S-box-containing protein
MMETLPYVILAVGISFLAIVAAIRITWANPRIELKLASLIVGGGAIWLLMSALEVTSSDISTKLFFNKISFVGHIGIIPTTWLILSMLISGYERYVTRKTIIALSIVPLITLLLIFTNEYHNLIWTNVSLNAADPILPLNTTYGLGYWLLAVGYSYAVLLVGSILFVWRIVFSRRLYRLQALPLTLVLFIPWALDVIYQYNRNLFGYVEPTAITLTVAAAILMWRLIYLPAMDVVPVAHEMIIDSMNDALIVLDWEKRIVDLNPSAQTLLNHILQDVVGQPVENVWTEWPSIRRILDAGSEETKEVSLGSGEKQRVYELQSTAIERLGRKDALNRLIILRDITERKMMEEELRLHSEQLKAHSEHLEELVEAKTVDLTASERKYHLLVDNMADAVFTIDLKGNLTFLSPQTEKITGYSAQQLLGMNIKQLIAPEDLSAILKRLEVRSKGVSELSPIQFELIRADGTRLPIELHTKLLSKGNEPVGIQGVARDITERKRMEDALRESEARFRELADLLPQIVFETDLNGTLTFFNRVGLSSTGCTEEDLRNGFDAFQVFPPEDARRAIESMRRVMRGEQVGPIEYRLLRKDGTSIPILIYSSAIIREGKPVGLRGIIVDMTERKRMEENLLRSRRLAAIGETAAMVGHDLRNPLQGIMGAAYLLKKHEGNLSEEGKTLLHAIEDGIERSDKVIDDLLAYSRELQLDLSMSNAKLLIDQSLASMKIPENMIVVNHTKEQPTVEVDVEKMKRVCLNLMKNAVDAMPNGGTLTITSTESDGNLQVSFADTGEGMSQEILAKIWSPLFTTKARGMGYGLAIVKRFMEAHRGSVSVETIPGKGSTFTIRIPIDRTADASMEAQTQEITAS